MSTRFYDTDLTDAAWAFVAPVLPDDPGNDAHGPRGHKADADQPQLSFCSALRSSLSIFQFPQKSVHVFEKGLARRGG
jgi:hypothetical protein